MVCIADTTNSDLPQPTVREDSHQGSISHAQISCVALGLQGSPAHLQRASVPSSGQLLKMSFCLTSSPGACDISADMCLMHLVRQVSRLLVAYIA